MGFNKRTARGRWRITKARTIDQQLLIDIRDHLEAIPLANELRHHDVETAKKLRRELDALHETIQRQKQEIQLLARKTGLDPTVLSDEELDLLTEVGASA